MPIFTSDLTSQGIIYADTITTNSNEDLTLNPAGTGSVVANARLKVNEISADDSTSVSIKSPLQLDSTLQVVGNLTVDANTLFVNSSNNRVGIGTTSPAYQVEIENTGANALLVLDRTDGAACFIEGQATRSAFGSVGATPLALAYNSAAVITIGESGAITVNPDGDGYTFPTTDGSANQFLITDGSGTVSFSDLPGDISVNQISAKDSSAVSITSPLQTGNIQSSGDITANDISLSGNLDLTSNGTITIGAGDSTADLTLTHDGTDVYLTKAGTSGEVYVRGRNISLQNDDGTQTFVTAGHGGATELYHGGLSDPGLVTTVSGGISIPNGTLLVNTIASGDSASVRINDSIETDGLTVNGTVTIGTGSGVTTILDEDNLSSDSDSALATQQSIKAYVDSSIVTQIGISDSQSNSSTLTLGTNDLEFRSGDSITATVSGTGVTFDLNSSITVDTINTSDSSALTLATSMNVNGTLSATSKNFVIDHPTKPNHTLRYASLEGPENGVYVRGHLKNNSVIQLPDYWTKLVDPDSITVNLTACGHPQSLWVESINQNTISVVGDDNINCFYVVYGTRIDIPTLEVESNGI